LALNNNHSLTTNLAETKLYASDQLSLYFVVFLQIKHKKWKWRKEKRKGRIERSLQGKCAS
jgi:hypothetical protein